MNTPFDSAIRLCRVVKRFGALTAVDGLDLDVPYGTCVGLLGPNGAGKSTTMKLLTAQVIADNVLWTLRKFVGLSKRTDDVTMIVARVG